MKPRFLLRRDRLRIDPTTDRFRVNDERAGMRGGISKVRGSRGTRRKRERLLLECELGSYGGGTRISYRSLASDVGMYLHRTSQNLASLNGPRMGLKCFMSARLGRVK